MTDYWSREKIFFDSVLFFEDLCAGVNAAKRTVYFETYIFDNDDLGRKVAATLRHAAERGVQVRVLVDGFGSPRWVFDFLLNMNGTNIRTKVFHPLLRSFWALNERNHRKVCVVDGRKAWTGGMNVSAAHSHWRDTGVFVEGRMVRIFTDAFQAAWSRGQKTRWRSLRRRFSMQIVRLNAGYKSRKAGYLDLINRIRSAKDRVWITNAYFVPPGKILKALQYASARGVDVKVVVPRNPDIFFVRWVSSALYRSLLESGVKIFEYIPAPLHAKTLIIDDWATVGTSNLNHRSLLHDLEVDVVLTSRASLEALTAQFKKDSEKSHTVSMHDWLNRSWAERLAGRILLLFRHWI